MNKLNQQSFIINNFLGGNAFCLKILKNNDVEIEELSESKFISLTSGAFIQINNQQKFFGFFQDYATETDYGNTFFIADNKIYQVRGGLNTFALKRISWSQRRFSINDNHYIYDWSVWKGLTQRPFSDPFEHDSKDFFQYFMEYEFDETLAF